MKGILKLDTPIPVEQIQKFRTEWLAAVQNQIEEVEGKPLTEKCIDVGCFHEDPPPLPAPEDEAHEKLVVPAQKGSLMYFAPLYMPKKPVVFKNILPKPEPDVSGVQKILNNLVLGPEPV